MSNTSVSEDLNTTEVPKFTYIAPVPPVFSNKLVKDLYDRAHSSEVAHIDYIPDIVAALLPYINQVINDPNAYAEAKTWNEFYYVAQQIETGHKQFLRMDPESSMCFALWMSIHH